MTERVLLVSGATEWREALEIALELRGAVVAHNESGSQAAKRVSTFKPTLAVIHADAPARAAPDDNSSRTAICAQVATRLRQADSRLLIMLLCSVPDDGLAALARSIRPSEILIDRGLDVDHLADSMRSAQRRMSPEKVEKEALPASATIEITIRETEIDYEARVGQLAKRFDPVPWHGQREVKEIDGEFKKYEADPRIFKAIGNTLIPATSRRLHASLFDSRHKSALEFCRKEMAPEGIVHYRFIVPADELEYVPFELVATENGKEYMREEYLREIVPIVRKLTVKEQHNDPDRPLTTRHNDGRAVLFLKAPVQGALRVDGHYFKGQEVAKLEELKHLDREMHGVIEIYGENQVAMVDLTKATDPVEAMRDAFKRGPYEVIHFAGHSVRSDVGNEVFLALPGSQERYGVLQSYSVDDFARRAAECDARLVILSSCESSSCRTLLRMAAFGVPAVTGFRWPVDDRDAAMFTPELHRELFVEHKPIVRAFHAALIKLKENSPGRLTWFSPVLMMQRSTWHDYSLEVISACST
jgi:DNA-binding NarL/FixJ family response regulator